MSDADAGKRVERRRAAILFADITGFTSLTEAIGDEDAYDVIGSCLELLGAITRRHGGHVVKYIGDCVMSSFGVPVALENADHAAVNAALEIRDRVQAYNRDRSLVAPLGVHTGINTGSLVAGTRSTGPDAGFDVMGDSVNVASRLKDKAPSGSIYVGPETYRATKDEFRYRALDALSLKGKSERLLAYELTSREMSIPRHRRGGTRLVSSPLVGRDHAFSAVLRAIDAGSIDAGRIVSLVADAGLGKSRLVAEVRKSVSMRRVLWLEGRSLSIGQHLSFHPFSDILRAWCGAREGEAEPISRERIATHCAESLGTDAPEVEPFLRKLMGLRLPDDAKKRLAGVEPEALDNLVRRSLMGLLEALARRGPVLLVFEDLHWADGSSIELLKSLLHLVEKHRISFLLVSRPGHPETSGQILSHVKDEHPSLLVEVELEPLDRGETQTLVSNLFEGKDLPRALRDQVVQKAAGNPFYAEEIVRSLLDREIIEVAPGERHVRYDAEAEPLPGTIQEVIMSRIERLPGRSRQVLEAAAVIGRHFYFDVLEEVIDGVEDLEAILEELVEAQFLGTGGLLGGRGFGFKHPLIQDVAYGSVYKADRKRLHALVAKSIEERLPDHVPGYDGMLAYHYGIAGDIERVELHLGRAGEVAAGLAASNEALHFFREAARLYVETRGADADPVRLAALERQIGIAHMNRGDLEEAETNFSRALELLGAGRPRTRVGRIVRIARTAAQVAVQLYAAPLLRRLRPATPRQCQVIEIMYARAQAQTTARPERFLFDTLDNLGQLSRVDARTVERAGAMYASTVGIFSYGGLSFGMGRRFLALGARVVRPEDPADLVTFRLMNFLHHFLEGDWSEEHAIDPDLLAQNISRGRLWEVGTYHNLAAIRSTHRGEFADAREHTERLAKLVELYRNDVASSGHDFVVADLHLERRELLRALAAARLYLESHEREMSNLIAYGTIAKIHALLGDLDDAEASLAQGSAIVARVGRVMPYHLSELVCAELLVHVRRLEVLAQTSGDAHVRAMVKISRGKSEAAIRVVRMFAVRRPETYRLVGTSYWLHGKRRAARSWWDRSLAEARRMGARPELARTELEAGRRLRADGRGTFDGRDAGALLSNAASTFEALALDADLDEVERVQ